MDETDYSIYGASQAAICYAVFLCLFGLATISKRKIPWRSWPITALGFPLFCDMFAFSASPLEIASMISKDNQITMYLTLYMIRNVTFLIIMVLALIWEGKRKYSNEDALQELCRKYSYNFTTFNSLKAAKDTIFANSDLQNDFLDFNHHSQQSSNDDDLRFMDELPETVKKQLIHDSEHFSQEAFVNAVKMGVLQEMAN